MRVLLVPALFASSALPQTFGVWKLDTVRSVLAGGATPKSLVVRVESHPKGEVFTLDTVAADGRRTSSSTILYFDGASRDLRDFDCQGTQSSRRLDSQTVEIRRDCGEGRSVRVLRRISSNANELVLEINEQSPDGRSSERRLVLTKQLETK
jgi:hypothetical protein